MRILVTTKLFRIYSFNIFFQGETMKLAVFTVMLPDLTPEEAAVELKASGYDGVEWRVTHLREGTKSDDAPSFHGNNLCAFLPTEAEAKRAKKITEDAGLAIPNIGSYINMGELDKVKAAIVFAKTLGSPHFRVGFGNFPGNYTAEFEKAKEFLAATIALAKEAELKPLVEIHHKTIVSSAALMHRLVSNFSSDDIGVIHDAGNMAHEGFEDYRIGLELLGDYLKEVHLKNAAFKAQDSGTWECDWSPLTSGVVNFDKLFSALKAINYDGWFALEDFSETFPSKEALRKDAAFLRDAWERA